MHADVMMSCSDGQVSATVDGEVVALRLADGAYFALDPVGSRIWELLVEPVTFAALCDRLVTEFEVEAVPCAEDTRRFLDRLRELRLVEVSDR